MSGSKLSQCYKLNDETYWIYNLVDFIHWVVIYRKNKSLEDYKAIKSKRCED